MNLNQITIKSKNVNRAVVFYKKLGLRLIVDSSPRYVRFECPQGDSTFSISQIEDDYDGGMNLSTVMYFEVGNLDEMYMNLRNQGIQFTSNPEEKAWLWREAGLNDPDGHPLIIYSAGINRKNPPWRVAIKHACDENNPNHNHE